MPSPSSFPKTRRSRNGNNSLKFSLYFSGGVPLDTQAGNLISGSGSTSDQGSLFASAGTVQLAFGSSIAVVAGTNYYASLWINSVTTAPTLASASSSGLTTLALRLKSWPFSSMISANNWLERRIENRLDESFCLICLPLLSRELQEATSGAASFSAK